MDAPSTNKRGKTLGGHKLTQREHFANVKAIPISSKKDKTTLFTMEEEAEILFDRYEMYQSNSGTSISQWSSLKFDARIGNEKTLLHPNGLYDPCSNDVCAKYLGLSNSEVLLHAAFPLPRVKDPGIGKALNDTEDDKYYPEDGQEFYMELCKEMEILPIRKFYDGLLKTKIDLTYCGVNPVGVRAMCMALNCNMVVEEFVLTDNCLTLDACYHLGRLLRDNRNLTSLDLTGCRIGPEGVRRLCNDLVNNSILQSLNLAYNNMGDRGTIIFSELLQGNASLKRLNLSHNRIGAKAAIELADSLECGNFLTHLNLAWNNLFSSHAARILIKVIAESSCLQEVDLSWNCLTSVNIGGSIRALLQIPTLAILNLSNNRLCGPALQDFTESLYKVRKLKTLNLSFNPLSDADAYNILIEFRKNRVGIQNLLFDNIWVNHDFIKLLNLLKGQKKYRDLKVTYDGVHSGYNIDNPDMRKIVLKRAEFLATRKFSHNKKDFGKFIMILQNESNAISIEDFTIQAQTNGIFLDASLINEMANAFQGPSTAKIRQIDLKDCFMVVSLRLSELIPLDYQTL